MSSRSRPRGVPTRDNLEETALWNNILLELSRAEEKNSKQEHLSKRIVELEERVARDGDGEGIQAKLDTETDIYQIHRCLILTNSRRITKHYSS